MRGRVDGDAPFRCAIVLVGSVATAYRMPKHKHDFVAMYAELASTTMVALLLARRI